MSRWTANHLDEANDLGDVECDLATVHELERLERQRAQ